MKSLFTRKFGLQKGHTDATLQVSRVPWRDITLRLCSMKGSSEWTSSSCRCDFSQNPNNHHFTSAVSAKKVLYCVFQSHKLVAVTFSVTCALRIKIVDKASEVCGPRFINILFAMHLLHCCNHWLNVWYIKHLNEQCNRWPHFSISSLPNAAFEWPKDCLYEGDILRLLQKLSSNQILLYLLWRFAKL